MKKEIDVDSFFDPERVYMLKHKNDPEEHRTSQFSALWRLARFVSWQESDQGVSRLNAVLEGGNGSPIPSMPFNEGFWVSSKLQAVVLYLMLLDLLSAIFPDLGKVKSKKGDPKPDTNGIIRMLREAHSPLSDVEMQAVKILRHTLAHNFGLASTNIVSKNPPPLHRFTLVHSKENHSKEVIIPTTPASQNYGIGDEEMQTVINVPLLIEYIEGTINKIVADKKSVGFKGIIGNDELRVRFTTI